MRTKLMLSLPLCLLSIGLVSCATKPVKVAASNPIIVNFHPPKAATDPVQVPEFLKK